MLELESFAFVPCKVWGLDHGNLYNGLQEVPERILEALPGNFNKIVAAAPLTLPSLAVLLDSR